MRARRSGGDAASGVSEHHWRMCVTLSVAALLSRLRLRGSRFGRQKEVQSLGHADNAVHCPLRRDRCAFRLSAFRHSRASCGTLGKTLTPSRVVPGKMDAARPTPDSLASELSSRSLLRQNSFPPEGKENEMAGVDGKRAGFMAPTQSSMRKKDVLPTGQPLANRMGSAKLLIPEDAPVPLQEFSVNTAARSLQDLRSR